MTRVMNDAPLHRRRTVVRLHENSICITLNIKKNGIQLNKKIKNIGRNECVEDDIE